jgi:hypothetical protein
MDGKNDSRDEAPHRAEVDPQPMRGAPVLRRIDLGDAAKSPTGDTTDSAMRYRDWASI